MMKRLFTLYCLSISLLLILSSTQGISQDVQILRETTGTSAASTSIFLDNSEYLIQESIGQASVIGTYALSKTELRQGFLQPLTFHVNYTSNSHNNSITVYPNPFRSSLHIELKEALLYDSVLRITDMMGRIVYQNQHDTFSSLNIDLQFLNAGSYILTINTSKQLYSTQIQKL